MPLHLLGKKSWNVYNKDNIEKVRRDEEEAKAREEAEEQKLQDEDAAQRIHILRGEQVQPPRARSLDAERAEDEKAQTCSIDRPQKRRRLRGEDDTDKEIRWAREDAEIGRHAANIFATRTMEDAQPLHDAAGHIQLVPLQNRIEAESQTLANLKAENLSDSSGMRFSDATGYKSDKRTPWYSKKSSAPASNEVLAMAPAKNVWGDDDPRRKEREQLRVISNDPLAFMHRAQRQLKQSQADRQRHNAERRMEVEDLKREQRHKQSRSARTAGDLAEPDNGFSLDVLSKQGQRHESRSHHRHSAEHRNSHRKHSHSGHRKQRDEARDRPKAS